MTGAADDQDKVAWHALGEATALDRASSTPAGLTSD